MALKYFPLTRIISNLYTRGKEFKTLDGRPYTGRYYKTYNGKAFTGINPVLGTNEPLVPFVEDAAQSHASGRTANLDTQLYTLAKADQQTQNVTVDEFGRLTEIKPYNPIPLNSDYERGYFTRYFAKIVSGPGYVFEISKLDWTILQNNRDNSVLSYETTDMLWQLTGPLNDKRISQYQIQGGVYDTNKRVTEAKAKGFVGLLAFIGGDYTKFAKITP